MEVYRVINQKRQQEKQRKQKDTLFIDVGKRTVIGIKKHLEITRKQADSYENKLNDLCKYHGKRISEISKERDDAKAEAAYNREKYTEVCKELQCIRETLRLTLRHF